MAFPCSCRLHQFQCLRPRFLGDRGAGQHACNFFSSFLDLQLSNRRPRAVGAVRFLDAIMMRSPSRYLRGMRDDQDLRSLGKPRQPLADRACNRSANAAIDLVEDHGCCSAGFRQSDL